MGLWTPRDRKEGDSIPELSALGGPQRLRPDGRALRPELRSTPAAEENVLCLTGTARTKHVPLTSRRYRNTTSSALQNASFHFRKPAIHVPRPQIVLQQAAVERGRPLALQHRRPHFLTEFGSSAAVMLLPDYATKRQCG